VTPEYDLQKERLPKCFLKKKNWRTTNYKALRAASTPYKGARCKAGELSLDHYHSMPCVTWQKARRSRRQQAIKALSKKATVADSCERFCSTGRGVIGEPMKLEAFSWVNDSEAPVSKHWDSVLYGDQVDDGYAWSISEGEVVKAINAGENTICITVGLNVHDSAANYARERDCHHSSVRIGMFRQYLTKKMRRSF